MASEHQEPPAAKGAASPEPPREGHARSPEPDAARRLHPFSWLFVLLTQLRSVALPLLLLVFFKRGDGWELWGAVGAAVLALYSLIYSWKFRYRLGDGELLVREGLFNRTERHIPYARIQNIVQKRNPLHRVFGVTELRLESAGGRKPEAVMNVITVADAQRLERVLRGAHDPDAEPGSTAAEAHEAGTTLLRLPLPDVLLLGVLGNRGSIVIGAFFASAWQFEWWERAEVREQLRVRFPVPVDISGSAEALGWVWTGALLVAAFLVVMKLLSVVVSLTSFYGFRLARDGDRVGTEAGLLTRHAASARVDKVQRLTVGESLLARFAHRQWLSCDVAAGGAAGEHDASEHKRLKWLAPIATHEGIAAVAANIDPSLDLRAAHWRPLHPRAARRRFRPTLFIASVAAVPVALIVSPALAATAWVVLVAYSWFEARGWARFAAYACDGHVFAFRAGWLTRRWTIARIAKGQVLSVSVSPFDRRHGMAKVQLDTAGSGMTDFRLDVPYLDEPEARRLATRLRAAME